VGWLSVFGNLASLISLAIAIWAIVRAQNAQEVAKKARSEAKIALDRVRARLVLDDVGQLRQLAEDFQGTCRNETWTKALELCDQLRGRLGTLRGSQNLSDQEQKKLSSRMSDLGMTRTAIDRIKSTKPSERSTLDSTQIEKIHELVGFIHQLEQRMKEEMLEI